MVLKVFSCCSNGVHSEQRCVSTLVASPRADDSRRTPWRSGPTGHPSRDAADHLTRWLKSLVPEAVEGSSEERLSVRLIFSFFKRRPDAFKYPL
jgi:hypothetical protein